MLAVLAGALILGGIARGIGAKAAKRSAADLGALAGARQMLGDYGRLFAPPVLDGRPDPAHLERWAYLSRARGRAITTARANGARAVTVSFPDGGSIGPTRIRVEVRDPVQVGREGVVPIL